MRVYVLDASVLIEAARRYYAFDLASLFWMQLIEHGQKRIVSIDKVLQELKRGHDDLATWAVDRFKDSFKSTDDSQVVSEYRYVMEWVNAQDQYRGAALNSFASGADGWLIAYATVNAAAVVTHEVFNPDAKNRVPLPNVCRAFDVPSLTTFDMMRELGIGFHA